MTGRLLVPVLMILVLMPACRQKSETRGVLETLESLARLAEKKDIAALMVFIDDDYSDFEGRDKTGLEGLLNGYFAGRQGIVIHRLGARVEFAGAGRAGLQTDVALSSGAAEALRRLLRISPDLYRLEAGLVQSGGRWLVLDAEWRPIGPTEVLPESLGPLKLLLPNKMME